MTAEPERESKLIIDEDWKSQVEEEKRRLDAKRMTSAGSVAADQSAAPAGHPIGEESPATRTPPPRRGPAPQPTLALLCTSLATQAFFALGAAYDPSSGAEQPPAPDFEQAKHLIGMLEMLETKTAGNRGAEESEVLENLLHELRMTFVAIQSGQG